MIWRAVCEIQGGRPFPAMPPWCDGGDWGLVASLVFKTSGPPKAGGGFDSHPPPPDLRFPVSHSGRLQPQLRLFNGLTFHHVSRRFFIAQPYVVGYLMG